MKGSRNIKKENECHEMVISEKCCYISFQMPPKDYSHTLEFEVKGKKATKDLKTCRKELMLFDFNEKNELLGIELLGKNKPCQSERARKRKLASRKSSQKCFISSIIYS